MIVLLTVIAKPHLILVFLEYGIRVSADDKEQHVNDPVHDWIVVLALKLHLGDNERQKYKVGYLKLD